MKLVIEVNEVRPNVLEYQMSGNGFATELEAETIRRMSQAAANAATDYARERGYQGAAPDAVTIKTSVVGEG